jgi:hypothetical protein
MDLQALFKDLSPDERIQVLDDIIQSCRPEELTHIRQKLHDLLYRDFVMVLPPELAQQVVSYLVTML